MSKELPRMVYVRDHSDLNYGAKCEECGEVKPLTPEMAEFSGKFKGKKIRFHDSNGACHWDNIKYVKPTGTFTIVSDCSFALFHCVDNYGDTGKFAIDGNWKVYVGPETVPFERDDYRGIVQVVCKETGNIRTICCVQTALLYWANDLHVRLEEMPKFYEQLDGSPLTKEISE